MPERTAEHVFSVTEITQLIKSSLEEGFPWVTIQGEISNFRPSSAGHWYFSLKDVDAMISVVMFRGRLDAVRFTPADGMLAKASGTISVYAKRGSYQLICETLLRAGEGDLLATLEARKRALAAEGLFDLTRKKPLPLYPSRIAVVTSPTGAAIRDILRILRRRNAGMDVVIVPTPVQGDEAAERIARAIAIADRCHLGDVIIVGRGGGSLEDLLPFSSEAVVRAIAAAETPIVSAVGHETDVTLSDLAADLRAPTPSAAAELVSASQTELRGRVSALRGALESAVHGRLEKVRMLLGQFAAGNLERTVRTFIQPLSQRTDYASEELVNGMRRLLTDTLHRSELASSALASCSPLSVLQRGYAVVTHEASGRILVSSEHVRRGDAVAIRLAQGGLRATVEVTHASEGS